MVNRISLLLLLLLLTLLGPFIKITTVSNGISTLVATSLAVGVLRNSDIKLEINDEILLTPPLLANLLIAGFVIPSDTGLVDRLVCLFPPVFPATLPLFPLPPYPAILIFF